jgi:hypothetical protein
LKKFLWLLPLFVLMTSCFWQGGSGSKPGIVAFTATPLTIGSGQSTTLMWNVTNATGVQIDQGVGSGLAAAGTITVSPQATTTFKLTAANSSGNSEASVTVTVSTTSGSSSPVNPPAGNPPQPPQRPNIIVFDINPNTINIPPGNGAHNATMRWEVKNAVNVTLNGSPVPSSGSQVLTPPVGTHTYILRAVNPAGEDTKTQTLRVNP